MTKIQRLLQQLKEKSSFSYDIALGQYQLLKDTKASKQAFLDFQDDLEGSLRMFQWTFNKIISAKLRFFITLSASGEARQALLSVCQRQTNYIL